MANGFRDPLAGINAFAPEFWKLMAQSAPHAGQISKATGVQMASAVPDGASPYPSFTDPFAPDPEEPEQLSPEDATRQYWWNQLGELPIYKGDPPKAELLPPAGEGESYAPPPRPPNEDAAIIRNITKFRDRLSRMEEFQRRGASDPKFDQEVEAVRKELEKWERALAGRAESGA